MAKKKSKKSKLSKTPFRQEIVDFLHRKRGKSFKRKEISHSLGVNKTHYHLFQEALAELVRSGEIVKAKGGRYTSASSLQKVQGALQMTRKGFAFVADERTGEEIFISAQNLNTALHQDFVEVQLFGVSRGKNKEGRVVQILSRARTTFVGTYHKSEYYGFVVPDDPRVYRDFYIPEKKSLSAQNGQKVVVELEKWDTSQLNPEGSIIEILGYPGDPGVDVSSVAIGHGLQLGFSKKVAEEARQMRLLITPEEISQRLDLRNERIFTIDPLDAKDFDDAVSLKKLENGNYRLGVHIADVSFFVKEGTPLDREALQRGTSVYLVDRVIPMLPEHLSNEMCSLQPHQDRLTFSCIMDLTPAGEVVDYQIRPSIINSKRRFTYEEVQAIIDDPNSTDPFAEVLKEMHRFSQVLREKRFREGSIDFNTPEVKFRLDERGRPVEIIPVQHLESHELIEEFMLMANQTVAKHIYRLSRQINGGQTAAGEDIPPQTANGKPARSKSAQNSPESKAVSRDGKLLPYVFRVHERPDKDKLSKFAEFLHALGYRVKLKQNLSPGDFQAVLKQIEGGKDEILIKEVALRTMMKAVYSTKNLGHFGLAFRDYTHFTSPIRRYPDLVVHRLLKEYQTLPNPKRLQQLRRLLKEVCEISSRQERQAMEAERESVRIKQVEWLMQHQNEEFEGLISGVMPYGIFVETIPYLIEGLVRIETLADDFYIYDEKTYSLIGKDTGRLLRLGDSVRVKVARIDREHNEVDFLLVEERGEE